MKRMIFVFGFIFCLLFIHSSYGQDSITKGSGKIIITVGDFMTVKGNLIVGLFDSTATSIRSDYIPTAFRKQIIPVTSRRLTIIFDSIPPGKYAIEAVHDENGNGKYEYQKEDYAFSNNARVNYNAVSFKRASFSFNGKERLMSLFLENENNGRNYSHYSNNTAFAPVFSYSPETSLLLGANVVRLFKFKGADSLTRTSYVDVFGAFTFNKQVITEQNYTLFSNREKYMFLGFTGFQRFPQYYYGIGNELPSSNKELVSYNQFRFEHLVLRNIYKKIFLGIGYRYVNIFDLTNKPNGIMATSQIDGYRGSVVSGIQTAVASDNRDNIYNTTKGHLVRVKATFNGTAVGSGYNFHTYEIDGRKFLKLFKNRYDVLAFQAYGYFSSGNVPWNEMGALGSDMIMRGYYSGRYRNKNYLAMQAEYRLSFNKMYGMVVFAGTGEVAGEIKSFTLPGLKPNAGFGFRMNIDRKERLNLRLDVGFGKNISNLYFTVAEAF
jgi:uncharacterized protein (DUF2141 family)